MTPLVDVAFLLLAFLVWQVAAAQPRLLQLWMPPLPARYDPDEEPMHCFGSQMRTIILGAGHQIYYYDGLNAPTDPTVPEARLQRTDFSDTGLRRLLLAGEHALPQPVICLKASPRATYRDLVDALDELRITDVRRYVLTRLSAADRALLPPAERE